MIDGRFEHITRSLEQETRTLKSTYDELSTSLSATNRELNSSFNEKAHHLKAMCGTFFAKAEVQIKDNIAKVNRIEESHDRFTTNFVNPAKEVDAKVFAMTKSLESCELMREA